MSVLAPIKRIRYIKRNNELISRDVILCNKTPIRVFIDTYNLIAYLKDANTGYTIDKIEAHHPTVLKRHVKKSLKLMGAKFLDEVRVTKRIRRIVDETV